MSDRPRGKTIPLSPARRMVNELMHHGQKVPSIPLARACCLAEVAEARRRAGTGVSWIAVFMRAYALVAQHHPLLRRAHIPYPYARLYEHPNSNCAVLIQRDWEGEQVVLAAKVTSPETTPLTQIDEHLRRFREDDVLSISPFRQVLRLGRQPLLLRRFAFWSSLNLSGFKRAKRFGTFMMSSLGGYGVDQLHPIAPVTTFLTFGPIQPDGRVTIRVIYDHRVMDGGHVSRALVDLERVLNTTLADEVREPRARAA